MSQVKSAKNGLVRLFFHLLDDIITNIFHEKKYCQIDKNFHKICLLVKKISLTFAKCLALLGFANTSMQTI